MGHELKPPLGARSDAELIRASREDPGAFEELFERHAPVLRQWLFAQTGDATASQDLLAEVFAQAWRGVGRFRGEDDAGAAWLYAIARNLLRQHYKRGRVETAGRRRLGMATASSDDGGIDAAAGRIDASRLSAHVREAFEELTPEQRRAIGYRVVEGLSYEEVGAELDCSAIVARSRVFRGLKALRTGIGSIDKGASP
jgi:RNA polymerase sigma factor (sigma-70 family)